MLNKTISSAAENLYILDIASKLDKIGFKLVEINGIMMLQQKDNLEPIKMSVPILFVPHTETNSTKKGIFYISKERENPLNSGVVAK